MKTFKGTLFQKNQILELELVDMNMMGYGIAKKDGAVIFVQNGVAGDRALCRIIKCASSYFVARIEKIITPSEYRIESACPHFKKCGGCSFQHVQYDFELQIKQKHVLACLQKEGLKDISVFRPLCTGERFHYRNKAQFPVSLDENGNAVAGFYSQKTHRVVPIDSCLIQDPAFSPVVKFVLSFMDEKGILTYDENTQKGLVRHIYLRRGSKTGEMMLCLVLTEDAFPFEDEFADRIRSTFPEVVSLVFNINSKQTNVILGRTCRLVYGKEAIEEILCGRRFLLSPLSFFQVNRSAAELLYRTAFSLVDLSTFDLILDLYCGIGSIGLSTHAEAELIGVEIVPEAVEDAKKNARLNGVLRATFYCTDAFDAFRIVREKKAKNPLVIVDPPRKGLSQELIAELSDKEMNHILYISCGPDTLARDLRIFREKGYRISPITTVDLFPATSHVESLVYLTR